MRAGVGYLLVAIASMAIAGPVNADPVTGNREYTDSALGSSGRVFSHVSTPVAKKNWAERELNRLHMARRVRKPAINMTAGTGRPDRPAQTMSGQSPSVLGEGAAADAPLTETDAMVPTSYLVGGGEGGEGFLADSDQEPIGAELAGLSAEFVQDAIGDIPGIAFSVADALAAFTDSTIQLLFNLKTIFRDSATTDWARVFSEGDPRLKMSERRLKKSDDASERRRLEEEASRAQFKRVVRSVFRILLGLALGWILWQIVRRGT